MVGGTFRCVVGATLTGANLSGADLTGTNLRGVDLTRVDLTRVDLARANLRGANLTGANLTRASLLNADMAGADLTGVRSQGIIGTPNSLPAGWQLIRGKLVGPGAALCASGAYSSASFRRDETFRANLSRNVWEPLSGGMTSQ